MIDYPEKAMEYFKEGYNCAQSVLAAFCNKLDMDFDTAMRLSSSFGGGMGRLREVCGAVSAMFMIAGLCYGYKEPEGDAEKAEHYRLIQELAAEFKKRSGGTIICRELLGQEQASAGCVPDKRTEEYYAKRPCVELIGIAAEIVEDLINKREVKK